MQKRAAGSWKTDETKTNIVASIEFTVRVSLREEYVDALLSIPFWARFSSSLRIFEARKTLVT